MVSLVESVKLICTSQQDMAGYLATTKPRTDGEVGEARSRERKEEVERGTRKEEDSQKRKGYLALTVPSSVKIRSAFLGSKCLRIIAFR